VTANISWEDLYAAAMVELDRGSLLGRIETAQGAIRLAMEELARNPKPGTAGEVQDLADALRNLQTLRSVECSVSTRAISHGQYLSEGEIR
jgi:hypothetical protein